ncbi:MAG: hypothetical protein WC593_09015 [Methanoregula sp.]
MCIPKNPAQQLKFFLIGGIIIALVWPFWAYGLKSGGIESLCTQYIVISTALMAILFAVIAIKQDKVIIERLKQPLFLISISLFTDVYAFFLIWLNSTSTLLINIFFSIATILLFITILEINLLTLGFLEYLKHQNAIPKKESKQ